MGVRSRTGRRSKAAAKQKLQDGTETHATKATEAKSIDEATPKSLWRKTFDRDEQLRPEDALKVAHWIRQAMGVLAGIVFGILQMTGFPAILTFMMLSFVGPTAFLSMLHELDIEEIGKVGNIQTEGLMPAFALFLLSWIISYTVFLPPST